MDRWRNRRALGSSRYRAGVEAVGEQGQRRAAGHLGQLDRADVQARGQVAGVGRDVAGGRGVRGRDAVRGRGVVWRRGVVGGHRDVEDGLAADRAGWGDGKVGHVPAGAVVPPRGRARVEADRAEFAGLSRAGVDQVQHGGEGARLVVRAGPADHGQRAAVRALLHPDYVPVAQRADPPEVTRSGIKQQQSIARNVLAPHQRVVAVGLPALVGLVRLVRGHDGQPAVGERELTGDMAAPAGHGNGIAAVQADPVQLAVRDDHERSGVRSPPRGARQGWAVGQRPRRRARVGGSHPQGAEPATLPLGRADHVGDQAAVRGDHRIDGFGAVHQQLGGQLHGFGHGSRASGIGITRTILH